MSTLDQLRSELDEGAKKDRVLHLIDELFAPDAYDELDKEEQKKLALLELLWKDGNEVNIDEIEPTSYDDCVFTVNERSVKVGTSPKKAKDRAALVRKALQVIVDALPKGDPNANRIVDRISTKIFVHRDLNETVKYVGQRMLSRDVRKWTTKDLADAWMLAKRIKDGHVTEDHLASLGIGTDKIPRAFIPTYSTCVAMFRELCPELVEQGIHDLVNSLYFLCPDCGSDAYGHNEHRDMLREAFDRVKIIDRRKPSTANDGEYLVCDDDEANSRWDDSLDSLLDDGGCVEGSDSPYFDRERWKRDSKTDGRGHSLGMYDGCERQSRSFFVYRTN